MKPAELEFKSVEGGRRCVARAFKGKGKGKVGALFLPAEKTKQEQRDMLRSWLETQGFVQLPLPF